MLPTKKRFAIIAMLLIGFGYANAQRDTTSSVINMEISAAQLVSTQPHHERGDFLADREKPVLLTLAVGKTLNRFALAVRSGVMRWDNEIENAILIPLTFNTSYYLTKNLSAPFIHAEMGYMFGDWDEQPIKTTHDSKMFVSGGIGFKQYIEENVRLMVRVSYYHLQTDVQSEIRNPWTLALEESTSYSTAYHFVGLLVGLQVGIGRKQIRGVAKKEQRG